MGDSLVIIQWLDHCYNFSHQLSLVLCIWTSLHSVLFFFLKIDWLIDWLLCWVFVSVLGLSLVAASRGHSSLRCVGLSLSWPFLLWSTDPRHAGSVVVAHGPSCSTACGIFPDQGLNPCSLHWQADSQPLRHQGSPTFSSCSWKVIASLKIELIPFRFLNFSFTLFSSHDCFSRLVFSKDNPSSAYYFWTELE